jgi:hypothetical protein
MINTNGDAPKNRIGGLFLRMEAVRAKAAKLIETDDRWTTEARLYRIERNALELNKLVGDLALELNDFLQSQAEAKKAQVQLIAELTRVLSIPRVLV